MSAIKMITVRAVKNGRKWETTETKESIVDGKQYDNIVDAAGFFRRIGGKERHSKSYTSQGYKTVKIVSTDPSGEHRNTRTFEF